MKTAIGIDFGTTYCRVAVFKNDKLKIITDKDGNCLMPCCVAFTNTEILIGYDAENQAVNNPNNTIFDIKRLIGKSFDDNLLQEDIKKWPFSVINEKGKPKVKVEYKNEIKTFSPEEICSMLLTELKNRAETYIGTAVTEVVISVPSYFTYSQRQAIKKSCTLADLKLLRVINDPAAAALAYILYEKEQDFDTILILDLGGGTLDVSIFSVESGIVQVRATTGNTHLGGEDLDCLMVHHFVEKCRKICNMDISTNDRVMRELRSDCEKAKQKLSHSSRATVNINLFKPNFSSCITRAEFKVLNDHLFVDAICFVEKCLCNAKINKSEIDGIVLIGGSTHIPQVKKLFRDFFVKKKLHFMNNNELVVSGAAIQAAIVSDTQSELLQHVLLLNAIPFPIGIKVGSRTLVMAPKDEIIPYKQSYTLLTEDIANQSSIFVDLYEGMDDGIEHVSMEDGKSTSIMSAVQDHIGKFKISGMVEFKTHCVPEIKITLNIDVNGHMTISATENIKGNMKELTVTAEDINESGENEIVEARKTLESYCMNLQTALNDKNIKNKISDDNRRTVIDKCDNVIQWLNSHQTTANKEELDAKRSDLECVCKPALTNCSKDLAEQMKRFTNCSKALALQLKRVTEQMDCLAACQVSLLNLMQTPEKNFENPK